LLTRNHRQEALSRAYVQAIAARCGMSVSLPNPDYGIDLTLNDIEDFGGWHAESGSKLDIQAKSTARAGGTADVIRYDLDLRSYDVLCLPTTGNPRILVVLFLPLDESQWCSQSAEELILRHCAYWLSLRGRPPSTNRKSIRISLPRANVFSVEALRTIMNRIKAGEEL
jgi:Domain of unknown function (DUF4365)